MFRSESGRVFRLKAATWGAKVSPDNKKVAFTQMSSGIGGYKYDLFLRDLNIQNLSNPNPKQLTDLNTRVFGIRFFNQRPYILFLKQKNKGVRPPFNTLRGRNI